MSDIQWTGRLLGLHAQTPLHAGSGTATGTVDMPIHRERHTQWPTIPGSALKGILRDTCRDHLSQQTNLLQRERWDDPDTPEKQAEEHERDPAAHANRRNGKVSNRTLADATLDLNLLFGPPTLGADKFAGALSVTDARLLAFPVRSARGVFAWVSCPAALDRLERDVSLIRHPHVDWKVPAIADRGCACAADSPCLGSGSVALLEELDFKRDPGADLNGIAEWIVTHLIRNEFTAAQARFPKHFLVLPDNDFTHFVRHATEVTARIALDYDTKTVKSGALFYQEFLPAETLLYSVILANPARTMRRTKSPAELLSDLDEFMRRSVLQIGGDESTGKGLCAVQLA